MPITAVQKAMGSAWRAPAPHKGNLIDILEQAYGVVVRIDRDGLIGEIEFNSRFMHTVAGVPMGIVLADLPAVVPDIDIGEVFTPLASGVSTMAPSLTLRWVFSELAPVRFCWRNWHDGATHRPFQPLNKERMAGCSILLVSDPLSLSRRLSKQLPSAFVWRQPGSAHWVTSCRS
jgi:hypothetical protein